MVANSRPGFALTTIGSDSRAIINTMLKLRKQLTK